MFKRLKNVSVLSGWMVCTLLLVTAGCNSDGKVGLVSGKIQLDGQPVPQVNVEFQPTGGSPSYGVTDAQGNYSLQLTADQAGAEVGTHTVRLTTFWIDTLEDGSKQERPEMFPPKYNEQSELKQEVKSGQQTINFDLESK